MELNTASFPVFSQIADVMFEDSLETVRSAARESGIFKVAPVGMNTGDSRTYTEQDIQEYAHDKGQSQQARRARSVQGYSKTLTAYRVALDIGISWEMRHFNKYPEVIDMLTNTGPQVVNRLDLDLSHRITFASATSYTNLSGNVIDLTVGDGLALASTVHTLAGSSTTFRNILANNPRLSQSALEAMERQAIENSYNHLGEKKVMTLDILWTTDDPNTVNTAKKILQSTADVDSSNAGVTNVNKAKYKHVILPRIATTASGAPDTTKRYYWGVAASRHSTAHLDMWQEPTLKKPTGAGTSAEEFSTEDWNFGGVATYGICWVTANWFHISYGDGTA